MVVVPVWTEFLRDDTMGQRLRCAFKSAAAVYLPTGEVQSNSTVHESGSLKVMNDK